jgi:hypothetical protein
VDKTIGIVDSGIPRHTCCAVSGLRSEVVRRTCHSVYRYMSTFIDASGIGPSAPYGIVKCVRAMNIIGT